jgi:hypothetical protein
VADHRKKGLMNEEIRELVDMMRMGEEPKEVRRGLPPGSRLPGGFGSLMPSVSSQRHE